MTFRSCFFDDAVQMDIDEVQSRRRAPVPEQARLDVRQLERLLQQRIVVEINLADREIVRRAPIGVHLVEQFRRERFVHGVCSSKCSCSVCAECQPKMRRRPCDHQFFVGANDAHHRRRLASRLKSLGRWLAFRAHQARRRESQAPRRCAPESRRRSRRCLPRKTSVSSPPSAAAKAPIHFFAW